MIKKIKEKRNNRLMLFVGLYLFLSTIFLSIGYAQMSVDLEIEGDLALLPQDDIAIINVDEVSTVGSNSYATIENYNDTILKTKIVLDETEANASVTLAITIKNLGTSKQIYDGMLYTLGEEFYSNANIVPTISMADNTILNAKSNEGDTITFNITFNYSDTSNIANNILNSTINFHFTPVRTITYDGFNNTNNLTTNLRSKPFTDNSGTVHYDTITLNSDDIPDNIVIKTNGGVELVNGVDYTYNNATGVITFLGNINDNIIITAIYKIEYVLNNGTNPNNQITNYKKDQDLQILEPIKENYAFLGWYTTSTFTGSPISSTLNLTGNTTLYAKWQSDVSMLPITELQEGDYVTYPDATGVNRECVVLYASSSGYGIQIITTSSVEQFEIGNGSGSATSVNNTPSGATKYNTAVASYNNARANLNTAARKYANEDLSPTVDGVKGARVVGTPPNNPDVENAMISSTTATYVSGKFRASDTLYSTDRNKINSISTININEIYWLGSYSHGTLGSKESPLYIRVIKVGGTLSFYSILTPNTTSSYSNSRSFKAGLIPVFTLKDTLYISGGNGTQGDPYTLTTGD